MSETTPAFSIQRSYIFGLGKWLQSLALSGRESRERTKFIETLNTELQEIDLVRMEIIKKYAEIDPDTKEPMMKEEDGSSHYVVPDEKMADFSDEFKKYLEEDFTMTIDGNIQRLKIVKSIVLDTPEKIDSSVAEAYDKWCDAFEKVEV